MSTKTCFYEILSVERTATTTEIKKAYRKIALANHPDRNPGDDEAVARFKEASEAYDILGDDEKRSRYDRYGHAGLGPGAGGGGAGFGDLNDIFSAFGDIFEGFGGGRRGGGGQRAKRGDHLQTSIVIELTEAARGCKRTVTIQRHKSCEPCDGSGAKPGTNPVTCDTCGGAGQVIQSQGFFRVQTTCPACRGEGKTIKEKCDECYGSGMQPDKVELEVVVPAGIDNGMQLCLRGEGDIGKNNGPRGDLYVDIEVNDHPLFKRRGNHLTCEVPITFTQAALGTELEIPALSGAESLKVPAGTQPGEIFRLRGQGMSDPRTGQVGDLHVTVQVEVPRKLDGEQERMLRELAEHEKANVSPHRKTFFEMIRECFTMHSDSDEE